MVRRLPSRHGMVSAFDSQPPRRTMIRVTDCTTGVGAGATGAGLEEEYGGSELSGTAE